MASDVRLKEQLPRLTDLIVKTYTSDDRINHLGHCPLPKYEIIVQILEDLKDLLYPGFRRRGAALAISAMCVGDVGDLFDDCSISRRSRSSSSTRIAFVATRMTAKTKSITRPKGRRSLSLSWKRFRSCARSWRPTSKQPTMGIRRSPVAMRLFFASQGLEAITIYRLAHSLHFQCNSSHDDRMGTNRSSIFIRGQDRQVLFHRPWTGVVVGETCEIGDHVKIYQGVTLGALSFQTDSEGQ